MRVSELLGQIIYCISQHGVTQSRDRETCTDPYILSLLLEFTRLEGLSKCQSYWRRQLSTVGRALELHQERALGSTWVGDEIPRRGGPYQSEWRRVARRVRADNNARVERKWTRRFRSPDVRQWHKTTQEVIKTCIVIGTLICQELFNST